MSSEGKFVIRGAEEHTLPPLKYGYWSALWAFDIAKGEVNDLSDQKYSGHPSVKAIRENILPFIVHVSAMYTAAYAAYAFCVIDAPSRLFDTMRKGVTVGMAEWLMKLEGLSSRNRVAMVEGFNSTYGEYAAGLIQDYGDLLERNLILSIRGH